MSENGEIYTAGKNFTLPPALTAWTNSTSVTDQYRYRAALAAKKYLELAQLGTPYQPDPPSQADSPCPTNTRDSPGSPGPQDNKIQRKQ